MATEVPALMPAAAEAPKTERFMGSAMAFSTKTAKSGGVASLAIRRLPQKEVLPTANAALFGNESTTKESVFLSPFMTNGEKRYIMRIVGNSLIN